MQRLGFALMLAVGFLHASPTSVPAQAIPVTVPDTVGSFILTESIPLEEGGVLLRYRDSEGINADLFITPPGPDLIESGATDSIMLDMRAADFVESLKYGVSRGWWEAYSMVMPPQPIVIETPSGKVTGRESVFLFRRQGVVFMSTMRLFFVNGHFVKSRLSMPEELAQSDKSLFGRQVMERIAPVDETQPGGDPP